MTAAGRKRLRRTIRSSREAGSCGARICWINTSRTCSISIISAICPSARPDWTSPRIFTTRACAGTTATFEAVLNVKASAIRRAGPALWTLRTRRERHHRALPWQTDTCIGDWHYNRNLFDQHRYKSVAQVAKRLINIVSNNGNLLLSIPVRGDGTIDADEIAFLEGMAKWIAVNGEGIYGTRPWKIPGEGPTRPAAACSTKAAPITPPPTSVSLPRATRFTHS